MDNIENLLKSILPLIIIIVVSWLISSLGARARKQAGTEQGQERPAEGIFDFLTETKEEVGLPEGNAAAGGPVDAGRMGDKSWPRYPTGGPPVTAKPIKPKWWGA